MRTEKEIKELIQKYEDIIWVNEFTNDECKKYKHKPMSYMYAEWKKNDKYNELEAKYDKDELFPDDEGLFSLYGKLMALKWVAGEKMYDLDNFINATLNKSKGVN
jgi:hypothetical protein